MARRNAGRRKAAPKRRQRALAAQVGTLIVDVVLMKETPQSGTWLFCFSAATGNASNQFHIPNQEYEGENVSIGMGLRLDNVPVNNPVHFRMNLDDDEADVCTDNAEDKSSGSFTASVQGQQFFRPLEDWQYTIYWHMENVTDVKARVTKRR